MSIPDEPTDWNNYQIPLTPGMPAETPAFDLSALTPLSDSRSETPATRLALRTTRGNFDTGRRILSFLLWWILGVGFALGVGVGMGFLVEGVLYERIYGAMPMENLAFHDWVSRRVLMTRGTIVVGVLLGGTIVRLCHSLVKRR